MALASLVVDLTIGLAKFEADSGKAAQIVGRDAEKMQRAAATFTKQLERQQQQATRTAAELGVIKGALLGLDDATLGLAASTSKVGTNFAVFGSSGTQAMGQVGAAASAASGQVSALLATMVGKLREVNAQTAALKAEATSQNSAGTLSDSGLGGRLAAINAERDATVRRLNVAYDADKAGAASAAATAASNAAFIAGLTKQADTIGKTRTQLLTMEAAQRGIATEAAPAIAKLRDFEAAQLRGGRAAAASAAQIGLNTQQLMTLKYTASDVVASLGSGASPFTVLLQQGGQVAQIEGGVTGLLRGLAQSITPFVAGVTAGTAAVGALAYAYFEGAKQSKAFADATVLSGNFAGQTEGQFNALTRSLSESGQITASAAREFGQALLATGEVGPEVFAKATRAAALFGQATGQTAKEVAKDFAGMAQDAGKWAAEHNRSMNFITAAQLDQIKTLQESGRAVEAQGLVYDALNGRLGKLEDNLGGLDRALRKVKETWSDFWNSAYDIGRADTLEDRLKRAQQAVAQAHLQANDAPSIGVYGGPRPSGATKLVGALEAQRFAERAVDVSTESAAATAAAAKLNKLATAGREHVDALLTTAKAAGQYDKALQKLNADIDANRKAGTPFSAAEEAQARTELKKKFTNQSAVSQADAERKAQLAKALSAYAADLAKEKDTLKFHQDELRAIYDAGNTSLAKYYDDRDAIIKAGTAAELAEQSKAITRLEQELQRGKFKTKDERTNTEKQLAEAQAKAAKIGIDADRAAVLATYERAAAVKALAKEVEAFQASLLDLQGDPLGAAQLRTKQQLDAARILASKVAPAGGTTGDFSRFDRGQSPIDLNAYAEALTATNDFAEVQRKVGLATADATRAEETYLLRAKQGGAGLAEQEKAIYTLRSAALVQLGELRDKASALADAENNAALAAGRLIDPKYASAAKDLALQYAQATQAVDPAMNRLKAHGDELGTSLANVFENAITRAQSFKDVVNSLGSTVLSAVTKTLITEPLEQSLKGGIRGFLGSDNPLADLLRGATGVTATASNPATETNLFAGAAAAGGLLTQNIAAQSAAATLTQLTASAGAASAALQALAAAGGSSGPVASGGGFTGWLSGLFGGGGGATLGAGASFSSGTVAGLFHQGGVVGQAGASRSVSTATFTSAQKYHGGGLISGATMPGLQTNEVPAILMGGPKGLREEVLHASDPRHRDNMSPALMRMLAAGGGITAPAAAFSSIARRYHTGGIAGMQADGMPGSGMRGGQADAGQRGGMRGGDTFHITVPPGTSRDTAQQIAARVSEHLGRASRNR